MPFTVAYPWTFILLVPLAFLYRWGRADDSRLRRAAQLRLGAVALLVIALAGPRLPGGEAARRVVLALDYSESMPDVQAVVEDGSLTAGRRGEDELAVIVFGADALLDQRLDASEALRAPCRCPIPPPPISARRSRWRDGSCGAATIRGSFC